MRILLGTVTIRREYDLKSVLRISVFGAVLTVLAGCAPASMTGVSFRAQGIDPRRVIDAPAQAEAEMLCNMNEFYALGEQLKQIRKPAVVPPKKSVLVLSGGGTYGAYSAGVLIGWSETGTRPQFDVVTGVSTGALIAALAFLGPEMDSDLRRVYTTVSNKDIYTQKFLPRSIFSESLADNAPLAHMIDRVISSEYMARVAEEHRKGRRLYVGTTEMDSRRPIIWDMGAISLQGTEEARATFGKLLLASAAIPGFFPPVRIPVEVDGRKVEELHVDGGVTQALFARPPWLPPNSRVENGHDYLWGSDLYIISAGKLYADPQSIPLRSLQIAANSVSTLIYSQTRDQLFKLYAVSILTGMNYRLTAIPENFEVPADSTTFDPVQMTRMFEEGVRQVKSGKTWRDSPPGLDKGEGVAVRSGIRLTTSPILVASPTQPPQPPQLLPHSEQGIPVGPASVPGTK